MTFTYDVEAIGNELVIAKLRLRIGDTIQDSGARPSGLNYSDEELLLAYSEEVSDLGRTHAYLCETLAAEWSKNTLTWRLGQESESARQAKEFRELAKTLRTRHGYTETGGQADNAKSGFSIGVKRA